MQEIISKVEQVIEPVAEGMGLELVDVEFMQDGGYWFLRVYIDKEDGIGLDECEKLSKTIENDVDKIIEEKFYLEVSSPGLERRLKKEKDFVRFTGEKVNIKLKHKINDLRRIKGLLLEYKDSVLLIETAYGEVEVPFKEIEKANLLFEFEDLN